MGTPQLRIIITTVWTRTHYNKFLLPLEVRTAVKQLYLGTRVVLKYEKHWRQRLSVTTIRGRVMVVTAAAARERERGNGEAPEEISAHSLG
jgi:hypothetical protein